MRKVLLSLVFTFSFLFGFSQSNFELRINTGGSEVDYNGETFVIDTYFDTGATLDRPQTGLPEPYQTFRYSRSQEMGYDIPVPNGEYTLNLHFAELWFGATGGGSGGEGSRVFDVSIESELVENNLDVFAEVGADAKLVKTHTVTITDGELNIDFDSRDEVGGERHPIINAIEILGTGPQAPRPFVTTWKTDNPGASEDNQITIPTFPGETYNYDVNWGDGSSNTGVTGNITHTYDIPGTYQVSISGDFPRIYFDYDPVLNPNDAEKIIFVNQWGSIEWKSMGLAFANCRNLDVITTDVPDLSNVLSLYRMFFNCTSLVGNSTFELWNVANVQSMWGTFEGASSFSQPIGTWDVSNVGDMTGLFDGAKMFNEDLSNWNTTSVTNMGAMFQNAHLFNFPIENWNVANVISTSSMFSRAWAFNQDIGDWDVSSVQDMYGMFAVASAFDQNIDNWDVSNVTNMSYMFAGTSEFDGNLRNWNVSKVADMSNMFENSGLSNDNYDNILTGWSQLPSMRNGVRLDAPQNEYCLGENARQKLIEEFGWTINDAGKAADCPDPSDFALRINAGGTEIEYNGETFAADDYFDTGRTLDRPQTGLPEPYQSFRYSRSQQMGYDIPLENGEYEVKLHFAELWFGATGGGSGGSGSRVFDITIEGELAEDNLDIFAEVGADAMLTKSHTVTVTDGELNIDFDSRDEVGGERHPIINAIEILGTGPQEPKPFVTTWKTDNPGASEDNQITIPTHPDETYNYSVNWGDGTSDSGVTGDITHTYTSPGTYQVSISGDFPRIYFNDQGDENKLLLVEQWGEIEWSSMENAFEGCYYLNVVTNDAPNLSMVSSTVGMFKDCRLLIGNERFKDWDTSNVGNMAEMFVRADNFNVGIGNWDVSNVFDMDSMFFQATSFNQDLSAWEVSNVKDMAGMFAFSSFNADLSAWQVGNVTNMSLMFWNSPFNQDISSWDVSSVTNMSSMFGCASSFNQNIRSWDVSNVTNMSSMFVNASSFNQDLSEWRIEKLEDASYMFNNSGLSTGNYDLMLIGWSELPYLQSDVQLGASQIQYCLGEAARQKLIDDFGWTINDAGKAADCPDSSDFALRINTGGTGVEYNGETFVGDTYFNIGSTLDRPQTGLPEPYQTFRYSRSQQMGYNIPLENGEYYVNLHFAELWFGATGGGSGGVGSRVFDITIEGELAEDNLDVFAEVGADAMLMKSHTVTVTDGELNIDFDSRDEVGGECHPVINAIEILLKGSIDLVPPSAGVSYSSSTLFTTAPYSVTFTSTSYDDIGIVSHEWDFGDGFSATGAVVEHTYETPGEYILSLTVTDTDGLTDNRSFPIIVREAGENPPIAFISASEHFGLAPHTVDFDSSNSISENGIASYLWVFGDGTTSTEANPSHTYTIPGEYSAILTLIDSVGLVSDNGGLGIRVKDPDDALYRFVMVNADDNSDYSELFDNHTLPVSAIDELRNIRVEANDEIVKSVRFELSGTMNVERIEDEAPYTLFGYVSGDYLGEYMPEGDYSLTAFAFSEPNGEGILLQTMTINITLEDYTKYGPYSGKQQSSQPSKNNSISLYPNMAVDYVYVATEKMNAAIELIVIYDMSGRELKRYRPEYMSSTAEHRLDLEELPAGMYVVVIQDSEGNSVQRKLGVKN